MAGVYINRANPLQRRAGDKGYRVAWKSRYGFERGQENAEMTYSEAVKKASDMTAKDKNRDKIYWAEMIMDPKFKM